MPKVKKIISSLICLLILVAFASAINFEFSSATHRKKQSEVSSANNQAGIEFQLVSEESDDWSNQQQALLLPAILFLPGFVFFGLSLLIIFRISIYADSIPKQYLYINFRSLRL